MSASEKHEPLNEVRDAFHVDWYRCPIERTTLLGLLERSDARGWQLALGHLGLFVGTGLIAYYCYTQALWVGLGLALFAHGTIASFFPVSPVHELGHGTVFKTPWLNAVFLRVFSLLGWWNYHEYAMSHTYHHRYTLHPRGDREVVLPRYPSLQLPYLIQLFTFNLFGGTESPHSVGTARTRANGFLRSMKNILRSAGRRLGGPGAYSCFIFQCSGSLSLSNFGYCHCSFHYRSSLPMRCATSSACRCTADCGTTCPTSDFACAALPWIRSRNSFIGT